MIFRVEFLVKVGLSSQKTGPLFFVAARRATWDDLVKKRKSLDDSTWAQTG